jgi:hypothetical protein
VTGIFHIVLARKPLEGTIAENCLQWGCGALWIDGTRVGMMTSKEIARSGKSTKADGWGFNPKSWKVERHEPLGRFPANLILGGEEVASGFPDSKGQQGDVRGTEQSRTGAKGIYGLFNGMAINPKRGDSGSASRFFFNFSEQESDE